MDLLPNFPTKSGKVPWTRQRHREAAYVSMVVKVPKLTADKLIRRARTAGFEYDLVDWDELQGGDLCYADLVDRLEEQVGPTYTKSTFRDELRLMQECYEEAQQHDEENDERE